LLLAGTKRPLLIPRNFLNPDDHMCSEKLHADFHHCAERLWRWRRMKTLLPGYGNESIVAARVIPIRRQGNGLGGAKRAQLHWPCEDCTAKCERHNGNPEMRKDSCHTVKNLGSSQGSKR
jgi:hypothetical protein